MSAYAKNVVRLISHQHEQVERSKYRRSEIGKDRQHLEELSVHLINLRRDLTVEVGALTLPGTAADKRTLKLEMVAFIEQVEALEAGMNKLIGALAAHQPR